MDKSPEVTEIKNEPLNSTLSDHLDNPSNIQVNSVKQECYCPVHTQVFIKTECYEDESELPVMAGTSYDMCPIDHIKLEIYEPLIQMDVDEEMQDPLDAGYQIKEDGIKNKTEDSDIDEKLILTTDEEPESSDNRGSNNKIQLPGRNKPGKYKHKKYTCPICQKTCVHIKSHLRIHTGEKPFSCSECKKSFNRKDALIRHERLHTDETTEDSDVDEEEPEFDNRRSNNKIQLPGRNQPGINKYKRHTCPICQKTCVHIKNHLRIHSGEKPYSCSECKKSFNRKDALIRHERIHTGDKPFVCDVCEKTFINKSDVIIHRRLHTGERPFSCDICNKTFVVKSELNRHTKKFHKN